MKRSKVKQLKYKIKKSKLYKGIVKLFQWIRTHFRKADVAVSKSIMEDEALRNTVQNVKEKLTKFKYNHKRGCLVWNSRKLGTYIRSVHGELK